MNEPRVTIYRSLNAAAPFLRKLAVHSAPWTFDIETYDAAAYPSRKKVSTSPSHPDFRVRGCAIAVSAMQGYWLEFGPFEDAKRAEFEALDEAFGSDAEKGAFNGGFDENGLVLAGWVRAVRNRTRDGMLGMVALGDGTQKDFKLSNGITVLLKEPYHWGGADKALMRDLPIEEVADGAVRDACKTHALCDLIDDMARKGEHIFWRRYGQKPKMWELMARDDADPEWAEPDPERPEVQGAGSNVFIPTSKQVMLAQEIGASRREYAKKNNERADGTKGDLQTDILGALAEILMAENYFKLEGWKPTTPQKDDVYQPDITLPGYHVHVRQSVKWSNLLVRERDSRKLGAGKPNVFAHLQGDERKMRLVGFWTFPGWPALQSRTALFNDPGPYGGKGWKIAATELSDSIEVEEDLYTQ